MREYTIAASVDTLWQEQIAPIAKMGGKKGGNADKFWSCSTCQKYYAVSTCFCQDCGISQKDAVAKGKTASKGKSSSWGGDGKSKGKEKTVVSDARSSDSNTSAPAPAALPKPKAAWHAPTKSPPWKKTETAEEATSGLPPKSVTFAGDEAAKSTPAKEDPKAVLAKDPRMIKLREDEAWCVATIAAHSGSTDLRSVTTAADASKELVKVRHAITGMKPCKEKYESMNRVFQARLKQRERHCSRR